MPSNTMTKAEPETIAKSDVFQLLERTPDDRVKMTHEGTTYQIFLTVPPSDEEEFDVFAAIDTLPKADPEDWKAVREGMREFRENFSIDRT